MQRRLLLSLPPLALLATRRVAAATPVRTRVETALGAFVPPPERRGLVLVDPPYEARDEFARLAKTFAAAHAKWSTGVYALWYPVKDRRDAEVLWNAVRANGAKSALRLELAVAPGADGGLVRTGLIVVNPPFVLEQGTDTDEAVIRNQYFIHLVNKTPQRSRFDLQVLLPEGAEAVLPQPSLEVDSLADQRIPLVVSLEMEDFRALDPFDVVVETRDSLSGRVVRSQLRFVGPVTR